MGFFKNLFGSKKTGAAVGNDGALKAIYSDDGFNRRYKENNIDPAVLDGCLKMVESYFETNKFTPKVASPINHPINLDQVVNEGLGFKFYCEFLKLGDDQAVAFLAFAFADFLTKEFGFKLYKDKQPEFPLRGMTLKYEKNGASL